MLRKIALLVLSVCLFTACGLSVLEDAETPAPAQHIESTVLLIDTSMDDIFLHAAQQFADEVDRLTGGTVHIEVRPVRNAAAAYMEGNGRFAFLDSRRDASCNDRFAAVSLPFLHLDYTRFTMVVNSDAILELVADGFESSPVKSVPIAAYYQPPYHFVSTWQPTNVLYFNEVSVAVHPSTGSQEGFAALGADVIEIESPSQRLEAILDGTAAGAEFKLEELSRLEWQAGNVNLYLTMYHTAAPVFLVSDKDFYNGLTTSQQAAVIEASAYLFSTVDELYTRQEGQFVTSFDEQGMLINPENFLQARMQLFVPLDDAEEDALIVPWQDYVWNVISTLE